MKSAIKTQIFHRKNTNLTQLKSQTPHQDLQNTSHTTHKKAFNRKPQNKINPFSQVIANQEQPLNLQKNNITNQINENIISKELYKSNISTPTNLLRNSKSVKFIRKGNQCFNQNIKQQSVFEQSSQNFGGQSLIIQRRSPQKILDNSYLDQVLSLKSIQKLKSSGFKYITKKKSFQNILDMSGTNSCYLDFIEECQSGKQNKNDSYHLKQQNQNLKKNNQRLNVQLQQLKNQIFKLKKRVNFLQNKSSSSNSNNNQKIDKKIRFDDNKIKNQKLQHEQQNLKRQSQELQLKIEALKENQANLNNELKLKQAKIFQLQQNISHLFQILQIKETSQLKLHDYLNSYKNKIHALSQQLRYKSIQNTILLKIKKDYLENSHQAIKFKDERDYFKMKLSQARKLNKQFLKETGDKSFKKNGKLQKSVKTNKSNIYVMESTSQTDTQYKEYQKQQIDIKKNAKTKTLKSNNHKKLRADIQKDEILLDLSQSEGGQYLQ